MAKIIKTIPNFFTILNLSAGFVGIIMWQQNIFISAYCVLAALVFDFLDGFLARKLNAISEIGKQLDSLADMVTFGVVPACIVLGTMLPDFLWIDFYDLPIKYFVVVLIPICAAIRLAKFNIDDSQTYYFKGLPTPANAMMIASLPFIVFSNNANSFLIKLFLNTDFLLLFVVAFALLMIIPIRMISLKFQNLSLKNNFFKYLLIISAIPIILIFEWQGIPLLISIYVLLSIVEWIVIGSKTR